MHSAVNHHISVQCLMKIHNYTAQWSVEFSKVNGLRWHFLVKLWKYNWFKSIDHKTTITGYTRRKKKLRSWLYSKTYGKAACSLSQFPTVTICGITPKKKSDTKRYFSSMSLEKSSIGLTEHIFTKMLANPSGHNLFSSYNPTMVTVGSYQT